MDGIDGAEVGLDVGDLAGFGFFFEVIEHFLLDIDSDDFAFGDEGGDAEAVVAGAGTDIGDDGIGCEIEEGDGFGWGFFFFAVVAFQPTDCGVSHDVGDFPAHEDFSDSIGRRWCGGVGGCWDFWAGWGRCFWIGFGLRVLRWGLIGGGGELVCDFVAEDDCGDEQQCE